MTKIETVKDIVQSMKMGDIWECGTADLLDDLLYLITISHTTSMKPEFQGHMHGSLLGDPATYQLLVEFREHCEKFIPRILK